MSVSTTTNRISYTGNGVQTVYPYTFKIFANTDLEVYVAGVKQTLTTHYTVSGAGDDAGGNVTFVTAPANLASVVLLRVLPQTQATVYPSNDKFPAKVHEAALDKLVMLIQQLSEVDKRSLKLAVTSTFVDLAVPDPSTGKFLRWKDLTQLENATVTGAGSIGVPVSTADGGTGASYASIDALIAGINAARWKPGADIASAATLPLPVPLDGNLFTVTGTTTITTIVTAGLTIGTVIRLKFAGVLTLTHSSNLVLQGAANYTTVANDIFTFMHLGSGVWQEIARTVAGGTSTKFWRGDGQWQTPPTGNYLRQTFRGLVIRTHPDEDKRKAQVSLDKLDEVIMDDGSRYTGLTLPLTANLASAGGGGLDTGAEAASVCYEAYLIGKSSTQSVADLKLILHRAKDYFLDEDATAGEDGAHMLRRATAPVNTRLGQGFKVDTAGKLEFVDLKLIRVGAVTASNIWVEIQSDAAGLPSGTVLATSDKLPANRIPTTAGLTRFVFRTPFTTVAATQYHIVLHADYAASDTVNIQWRADTTAATYANGSKAFFDGATWTADTDDDFTFKVFVTRNDAAVTMPSGYDQLCLLSPYNFNDSGSDLKPYVQNGRRVVFRPVSNGEIGAAASASVGVLTDLSAFVPPRPVMAMLACSGDGTNVNRVIAAGGYHSMGDLLIAANGDDKNDWTTTAAAVSANNLGNLPSAAGLFIEYQGVYFSGNSTNFQFYIPGWEW